MTEFRGCRSYQSLPQISRRNWLKAGALGSFGLSLPQMLRYEAQAAPNRAAKAKSVILFWLQGGVSHHETFDPKPAATPDIRGEFSTISTRLPGVIFSNYLPKLAGMADKLAVIRSVTHREAAHERGSMYMVEGRRSTPGANGQQPSGNPQIGSIVAHELGMQGGLPPFVSIPGKDFTSRFVGHGYLPAHNAAFKGYQSQSLTSSTLSGDRFAGRLDLRTGLRERDRLPASAWDDFDQQAVDIIMSGKGAAAFDISDESDETKQLYGLDQRRSDKGTYALIARRLVDAGVRYVTIGRNSWDHHSKIFPQLRSRLPSMDSAISGLITDLERRGQLDDTLVVYMTEYGRTPKINAQAGRDHWPSAFSIAFAGAGIRPGQVIGASDRDGASVIERPVSPEQIAATILHLVGIPPQSEFIQKDGRPIRYVDQAQPIGELLA